MLKVDISAVVLTKLVNTELRALQRNVIITFCCFKTLLIKNVTEQIIITCKLVAVEGAVLLFQIIIFSNLCLEYNR